MPMLQKSPGVEHKRELTVGQFFGLQAIVFGLLVALVVLVRVYDSNWPAGLKLYYWAGCFALYGIPVLMGLRTLAPV